jgi:hypothetical protein
MGSTASTDFQHYNVAVIATPSPGTVFLMVAAWRELDETDIRAAAKRR